MPVSSSARPLRPRARTIATAAAAAVAAFALSTNLPSTRAAEPAEAGAAPALPGALSGELRHLLRGGAEGPGDVSASAGGIHPTRPRAGIAGRFAMRPGPGGTLATFRAILDGGSGGEIAAIEAAGGRIRGRVGRVATFEAPLTDAWKFARLPGVSYLDLGRRLRPELDLSVPATGADLVADGTTGFGATGAGVLVAIIDAGQDVKHMDFRHPDASTRFRSVWNMDPACGNRPPPGHTTGCYYQQGWIDLHLRGKKGMKYKDSQATGGHGTHVMGIAAGNGLATRKGYPQGVYAGMAPGADLIGVKVIDDDGGFVGDMTEALQFLGEEQARLGNPPLVVNLSLGHQAGAHDGSDPDEVAIDEFVQEGISSGMRRVVVKSAGNDGGSGIYASSSLDAPSNHPLTVPSSTPSGGGCGSFAGAGNDYVVASVWYPGGATIELSITAPNGTTTMTNTTGNDPNDSWIDTSSGTLFVDCPAELHPVNGDRQCIVGVDDTGGRPPAQGTWTVSASKLSGPSGGKLDAWVVAGDVGLCTVIWDSPSPGGTISIPGTAHEVITVGAWVTKTEWVDYKGKTRGYVSSVPATQGDLAWFSSEGPTRDGRIKPDLAAPGMGIASARARTVSVEAGTEAAFRTVEDKKHIVLEGTSMASPHVAGAAALLLELDPSLQAPSILALLTANAATDGFTGGSLPDGRWGAGKLDIFAAASDHLGPP